MMMLSFNFNLKSWLRRRKTERERERENEREQVMKMTDAFCIFIEQENSENVFIPVEWTTFITSRFSKKFNR